MSLYYKIS